MNVLIHAQGFDMTRAIETAVRTQFETALGRLGGSVDAIDVYLSDLNGPKGGRDKQVVARIRLFGRGAFAVESTRADLYKAIAICARRAKRVVRRSARKARRIDRFRLRQVVGARTVTGTGTL